MAVSVILALIACSVGAFDSVEALKTVFTKTDICPLQSRFNELQKLLEGVADARTCFVECATLPDCWVLFLNRGSDCYFGNATQMNELFSPTDLAGLGGCSSHIRSASPTTAMIAGTTKPSSSSEVTTTTQVKTTTPLYATLASALNNALLSKLLIMFDFRQGFANLANPAKYSATLHGSVTRDSQGAHFPTKSAGNYIDVDTDVNTLVPSFLGLNNSFTFFARLMRNAEDRQTYHIIFDCSSTTNSRGEFGDNNGKLRIFHPFPAVSGLPQAKVTVESIETFFARNNNLQLASVGAVFFASGEFKLFKDGALLPNATVSRSSSSGSAPLCLRLGYNSESSYALEGRFICYAVAKEALSESELQQLEAFCAS